MVSANVLGVIGNVTAVFLFLSHGTRIIEIVNTGTVGEFSSVAYHVTFVRCFIWMFFGLPSVHPNSSALLIVNIIGVIIQSAYLLLFFIYSARNQKTRFLLICFVEIMCVLVLATFTLTIFHSTEVRSAIFGTIGGILSVIMYATPLTSMGNVIAAGNVELLLFLPSLFSFLNSIIWFMNGLIDLNPYVAIPNGIGFVLGGIQMIVYVTCYFHGQQSTDGGADALTERLVS